MTKSIYFLNTYLDLKNYLYFSLTKIFGINLFLSTQICKKFGFTKKSFLKDVSFEILNRIRKYILTMYKIQDQLKNFIYSSIHLHIYNKSIIGLRHKLKLPVRGQRTHTNRKTVKKL